MNNLDAGVFVGKDDNQPTFKNIITNLTIIINKLFKQISKNLDMNANKFIVKLLEMMKEYPSIINWSSQGLEIEIFDIERFSSEVHPKFFTTSNYRSFLRQLNMYNFKKMSKRKNSVSFSHSLFQRGNELHFASIKRRLGKPNRKEIQIIKKQTKAEMEENQTDLSCSVSQLDPEIREVITLLKKQTTQKGTLLLQRLQRMLERASPMITSQCKLSDSLSTEQLKQFVSFCRIEELMLHKQSDFNFESHLFNNSIYFEE